MEYLLTFANVPFVSDTARVFRMQQDSSASEKGEESNYAPRKHQPLTELMDEIDRLLPFNYFNDQCYPSAFPGRNLGNIAYKSEQELPVKIRIGDWYYPNSASKWSIFRGLADSYMVKTMLSNTGALTAATFKMTAFPGGAPNLNKANYELETSMYMLPPRPLGEHGGQFAGLYLVTLVDERFFFQNTPVSLHVDKTSTWESLINQAAIALNITISPTIIETVYGTPELDSPLWTNWESAPILLDALAANIGRTLVRKLNGSYALLTPTESNALALSNRQTTKVIRTAGGDIFNSGNLYPVGDLRAARNPVVPSSIAVTFPLYVTADDPVPHFVNSRYANQRRSCHYEEGYGDVFTLAIPITSGGSLVSGLTGISRRFVHDTAKALISGEIFNPNSSGVFVSGLFLPYNYSGLYGLAAKIAQDQYGLAVAGTLDEVYPGSFKWEPDGVHDIVWTYSERAKQATCRVMRASWTQETNEFQHATPNLSGYTANPRGVGGPSVAQTIRDSSAFSGITLGGYLTHNLLSGQTAVGLTNIDGLPTDQRWRGRVENEFILFEGTSGGYLINNSGNVYGLTTNSGYSLSTFTSGMSSGYNPPSVSTISGYAVQIVYRGIDGTLEQSHAVGAPYAKIDPDAAYGVNLTTYGKNQYVYPAEWTSGGIQGVNVVPQTQFVKCLSSSGIVVSGTVYFSGRLQYHNRVTSGAWVDSDFVWMVGPNTVVSGNGVLSGLTSDVRYGAVFTGYSVYSSGSSGIMIPAAVYVPLATPGGGGSFTLSVKDRYGPVGNISGAIIRTSGFSGNLATVLTTELKSGDTRIVVPDASYFPTANRWRAFVGNSGLSSSGGELILLEGTSGGIDIGVISADTNYQITIVQRGLNGTSIESGLSWASGTRITEVSPHVISGATLLTHDIMQFVYPGEISPTTEVVIKPQMQTVFAEVGGSFSDGSTIRPTYINGVPHYSGFIGVFDSTRNSGGMWVRGPSVWLIVRDTPQIMTSGVTGAALSGQINSGFRIDARLGLGSGFSFSRASGQFVFPSMTLERFRPYLGQLVGYSKHPELNSSGLPTGTTAPVYVVDPIRIDSPFFATIYAIDELGGPSEDDPRFQTLVFKTNQASIGQQTCAPSGGTITHANGINLPKGMNIVIPEAFNLGEYTSDIPPRWDMVTKTGAVNNSGYADGKLLYYTQNSGLGSFLNQEDIIIYEVPTVTIIPGRWVSTMSGGANSGKKIFAVPCSGAF